ncbi:MAG: hypothetical protein ACRCVV_03760, partial [Shewanella sp.]
MTEQHYNDVTGQVCNEATLGLRAVKRRNALLASVTQRHVCRLSRGACDLALTELIYRRSITMAFVPAPDGFHQQPS